MDTSDTTVDIAARLQALTPEEKLVLRLRFALDGSYNHTLQDIASGLNIGKDQVREIERGALAKLAGAKA